MRASTPHPGRLPVDVRGLLPGVNAPQVGEEPGARPGAEQASVSPVLALAAGVREEGRKTPPPGCPAAGLQARGFESQFTLLTCPKKFQAGNLVENHPGTKVP